MSTTMIKSGRRLFRVVTSPLAGTPYHKHEIFHGETKIAGVLDPVDREYCDFALSQYKNRKFIEERNRTRGYY
jgi:hypothetical protein